MLRTQIILLSFTHCDLRSTKESHRYRHRPPCGGCVVPHRPPTCTRRSPRDVGSDRLINLITELVAADTLVMPGNLFYDNRIEDHYVGGTHNLCREYYLEVRDFCISSLRQVGTFPLYDSIK
ncbi:hypothetical protein ACJJTC_008748 [Scirpophaga incertulas]